MISILFSVIFITKFLQKLSCGFTLEQRNINWQVNHLCVSGISCNKIGPQTADHHLNDSNYCGEGCLAIRAIFHAVFMNLWVMLLSYVFTISWTGGFLPREGNLTWLTKFMLKSLRKIDYYEKLELIAHLLCPGL